MVQVLIVSATDLTRELGRTVLWRRDIERVFAPHADAALALAQRLRPGLVVVDAADRGPTLDLVRRLRQLDGTRRASLLVLWRSASLADEGALREAGVNQVLAGEADPVLWDSRLEELLSVPRRRDARIPVRLAVWSHVGPGSEAVEALALNISVRGLLLETDDALDLGTRLDLTFRLPGDEVELAAVGQVVREAEGDGRPRAGVELLILRGDARDRIRRFIDDAGGRG